MSTILVCGGRSYCLVPRHVEPGLRSKAEDVASAERDRLVMILDAAVERLGMTRLVAGDATGADNFAISWAKARDVECKVYPADWDEHGPKAGPLRNRQMLEQELPSAVIAFPGSKGTRDMVTQAERAGVRVIKVDW